jgi:hypothetical protein
VFEEHVYPRFVRADVLTLSDSFVSWQDQSWECPEHGFHRDQDVMLGLRFGGLDSDREAIPKEVIVGLTAREAFELGNLLRAGAGRAPFLETRDEE